MAAFAAPYNMAMRLNLNGLGYLLIAVASTWTVILAAGMFFLALNRNLPFLRNRSIPLAIKAVALLHVYWVLCLLAYVLNGLFPCAIEFWVMSFHLPLGIALYQATNTRLLHVAALQSEIASSAPRRFPLQASSWGSKTATQKTTTCIEVGMGVQVVVSLAIFLMSRNFHPGFGVIGHPDLQSAQDARKLCRMGPEWIPSIIWQLFWAWCYAPYLLWKVRKINDIHGWRLQTIICCIAG